MSNWKCINCGDYLCEPCSTLHRKGNKTGRHRLLHIDEKDKETEVKLSVFCVEHTGEELEHYCETDRMMICPTCKISTHRSHDICSIEKIAEEKRTELGAALLRYDKTIPNIEKALQKFEQEMEGAKMSTERNCHIIDMVVEEIRDAAEKLKEKEADELTRAIESIKRRKGEFAEKYAQLHKTVGNTRRFLETCTEGELITDIDKYVANLKAAQMEGQVEMQKNNASQLTKEGVKVELLKL